MIQTQPYDRIRDYLYEHGAASIDELVAACGVTRFDVLHYGYLKTPPREASGGARFVHCALCHAPAIVNDLCDGCRKNLNATADAHA